MATEKNTAFQAIEGYTALCAVGNKGGDDFAILAPDEETLLERWKEVMGQFEIDMSSVHAVTILRNHRTAAEQQSVVDENKRLREQLREIARLADEDDRELASE